MSQSNGSTQSPAERVDVFTIGIEEEFLLIDPESRELTPQAQRILADAGPDNDNQVEAELQLSQVETGTTPCDELDEVRAEVLRLRKELASAAQASGKFIGASGTHPFSDWRTSEITPKGSYLKLEADYQQVAREQIVCGCHIHVGISDDEAAIQVMNRVRPWLSPIRALSVNSPFWLGYDTGYCSYRTELWQRWPIAGTPHHFGSRKEYDALVETLLATGGIDDPARIYWDVRPSAKYDTLEFRMTDVCLTVDETVMVAGLVRALARTCYRDLLEGTTQDRPRPELLRAATWRAARYGVDRDLIDVVQGESVPAAQMIDRLLEFLEPSLEDYGEKSLISELVQSTMSEGTGATRQRAALSKAGRIQDVVDLIVDETTNWS
ncbi:MAG TPA: carboxylate-amine ligase [Actinomycetota bacterium]|nr:carboxylate-amine ligase [Actinomycetota bacterium]